MLPETKVLCVPAADPRMAHQTDVTDLERFLVDQGLEPGKGIDAELGVWAGRAEVEVESN